MIVVSSDLDAEVAGTSIGDSIQATAWRGGLVVAANLAIQSFSMSWDAGTDQVHQGKATLVVADPDGLLSPWSMGDPLGPGGSRVSLAWVSGASGIRVPRGMWRIRAVKPAERWRVYNTGATVTRVPGGGMVTLTLEEDPTASAAICRIDGDAPVTGATALTELRRILAEYGSVDASLAPADVTIQPSYTAWPEMRTDAIGDLLDMLGARSRIGGDGSLQVIPATGVGPVWTIRGDAGGALIEVDRELNDTGVYNAVTSKGTAADGSTPLVGRAYTEYGPLAYGGPFGKVPIFHQAITASQSGVTTDASTYLARIEASGTIDLPVSCLAHPALQINDLVTVVAPTRAGDASLVGRVIGMTWSSVQSTSGSVPGKKMSLVVRVTTVALEQVAAQVRRG